MNIYKKAYFLLFNAITDALEQLEQKQPFQMRQTLITAQQNAEELIISSDEEQYEKAAFRRPSLIALFYFPKYRFSRPSKALPWRASSRAISCTVS